METNGIEWAAGLFEGEGSITCSLIKKGMTMKFKEFFDTVKETAQYRDDYSVVYPALGLAGETGEAVDIVKKSVRYKEANTPFSLIDGKGRDRTEDMKLELGDVMWYWCNLVKDLGFDPEELFQKNYEKLRARYEK